jgi:hypothetical protein
MGYVPNPEGVERFKAELELTRPAALKDAAPHLMKDGQSGDILSYLAYYGVEVKDPDGTVFKSADEEPPYEGQTGNNCTAKSTANLTDLLQFIDVKAGLQVSVHRIASEATYAFGLARAGMRGDNGCYGAALAKAFSLDGQVDYKTIGAPFKEDARRLQQYANNPSAVVQKFAGDAAAHKGEVVHITTIEEALAWFANSGLLILPSNVGFADGRGGAAPRDANGIVRARGSWAHQMFGAGVIRTDGIDTIVISQSWGKNTPDGPKPFKLPSYMFRATFSDFQRILDAGDVWGLRKFAGFEPKPLAPVLRNLDAWGI